MLSSLDRAQLRDKLRDIHEKEYKNKGVLDYDAFAADAFEEIDKKYHQDIILAWLAEQAQEIFTQPSRNTGSKKDGKSNQGRFWEDTKLHARYNVKRDGKTVGVATGDLTLLEYDALCARRVKGISTDQAHLSELQHHLTQVRPYWLEHPYLTFSEVRAAIRDVA